MLSQGMFLVSSISRAVFGGGFCLLGENLQFRFLMFFVFFIVCLIRVAECNKI